MEISGSTSFTFKIKPAQQDNLGTSEDVPKKKVLTATEPVLPSSSKKSMVNAISLGSVLYATYLKFIV